MRSSPRTSMEKIAQGERYAKTARPNYFSLPVKPAMLNLCSSLVCFALPDVGDIQSRLLDHRPVINAEIRYFVKEFEVVKTVKCCRVGGARQDALVGLIWVFCVRPNVFPSFADVQEKRGNTESRMLENINKMVLEINEELQLPDFEAMAQQLSEVKKCRECPPTRIPLTLFCLLLGIRPL